MKIFLQCQIFLLILVQSPHLFYYNLQEMSNQSTNKTLYFNTKEFRWDQELCLCIDQIYFLQKILILKAYFNEFIYSLKKRGRYIAMICKPFSRYHMHTIQEEPSNRKQIIPNKILFSDFSTMAPINSKKKKKIPLFTIDKANKNKNLPLGSVFTNRGIMALSQSFQGQSAATFERRLVKMSIKKGNYSQQSLFNRLILTPFNFVRPKTQPRSAKSSPNITERKKRLYTPNKTQTERSFSSGYGRPSPYRRIISVDKLNNNKDFKGGFQESFAGWQTINFQTQQLNY